VVAGGGYAMAATGPLRTSNRTRGKPTLFALLTFFNTEGNEHLLSALSERDQRIVRLVVAGYTYASIAQEMGVTTQRVSQVAKRSLWLLEGARIKARRG